MFIFIFSLFLFVTLFPVRNLTSTIFNIFTYISQLPEWTHHCPSVGTLFSPWAFTCSIVPHVVLPHPHLVQHSPLYNSHMWRPYNSVGGLTSCARLLSLVYAPSNSIRLAFPFRLSTRPSPWLSSNTLFQAWTPQWHSPHSTWHSTSYHPPPSLDTLLTLIRLLQPTTDSIPMQGSCLLILGLDFPHRNIVLLSFTQLGLQNPMPGCFPLVCMPFLPDSDSGILCLDSSIQLHWHGSNDNILTFIMPWSPC